MLFFFVANSKEPHIFTEDMSHMIVIKKLSKGTSPDPGTTITTFKAEAAEF
jgi:hypothetical protein